MALERYDVWIVPEGSQVTGPGLSLARCWTAADAAFVAVKRDALDMLEAATDKSIHEAAQKAAGAIAGNSTKLYEAGVRVGKLERLLGDLKDELGNIAALVPDSELWRGSRKHVQARLDWARQRISEALAG